jgi:signal transduction histidine kinase
LSKTFRFSWRNLIPQLVAIVILPLAVFTLVVVLGGLLLHQDSMRTMVGERDERAVRAAAAALAQELTHRFDRINLIQIVIDDEDLGISNPKTSLQSGFQEGDFNRGIALLDMKGQVLWYAGSDGVLENLTTLDLEHNKRADFAGRPMDYQLYLDPSTDEWIILIFSTRNQVGMRLIGAHSLNDLIDHTLSEMITSTGTGMAFVVTSQMEIIYSTEETNHIGLSEHPGISEALKGKSGSSIYEVEQDEIVVAYSPVTPFNWVIVVEESWKDVANPLLRSTEIAPLFVIPVLLLALLAIWFGTRYVVQPMQRLETRAFALARGDYETIEQPVGGIAEIHHLQATLVHLAYKVKTAQQGLRSYIGAITMGQEDERRRLARELHDDTLQSLIALNQRIQLAELNSDSGSTARPYAEIRSLTEDTIQNLRRITRALRPIYLEDLGLSAALEMLVREIEVVGNIEVEFRKKGTDRRLPETVELALYRIAQEALNNVVRHASADRAMLNIEFSADQVLLEVSDDGRGFDVPESPAELVPDGHYGLLSLYERAELIGASLAIHSERAAGTSVRLLLPNPSVNDLPFDV